MPNSLTWLTEFLEIVCSGALVDTPEQFDIAKQKLIEHYSPENRHKYSSIASLLRSPKFNDYTSDQFDTARENFRSIEACYSDFVLNEKHQNWIEKLFDYLELEIDRIINIDRKLKNVQDNMTAYSYALRLLKNPTDSQQQIHKLAEQMAFATAKAMEASKKATKAMDDSEDAVKKVSEALEKAQQASKEAQEASTKSQEASTKVKEFNTQSITILSIFTAVVFAFTGGFTMLGSAFSNLKGISRSGSLLLIALVLIVGCVLLNVIYFLIYFIGRISEVPIGVSCHLDCKDCTEKSENAFSCGWKKRFLRRHFVIKSVNLIVAAIIALILLVSFCNWDSADSQAGTNQAVATSTISELTPEPTDAPVTLAPTITPTPEAVESTPVSEKTSQANGT